MGQFGLKVFEPPPAPPPAPSLPQVIAPLTDRSRAGDGIPQSPPIRGELKYNLVNAGGLLTALGLGIATTIAKSARPIIETGKFAQTALIGRSLKAVAGFNLPLFFGPLNDVIDRASNIAQGYPHLPTPHRPLLDLEGFARNIYTILGYVPGISEEFSELNRKILQRDFQPEVDTSVANANRIITGFVGREDQVRELQHYERRFGLYIEAGAKRESLEAAIIDIRQVLAVHENAPEFVRDLAVNVFGIGVTEPTNESVRLAEQREAEQAAMLAVPAVLGGIIRSFPMRGQGCMR